MLLPDPIVYPSERVPKHAVLSVAHFRGATGEVPASILDVDRPKFVTRGTQAIALCLAHADIGPSDAVLLPAYHCTSMVLPVKWRGARPVFYRIKPDTSVDLVDVERKIDRTTRLLIAPHYFGFPQNATQLREFCDRHRLIFIEDCAHAFFGSHAGAPLGSFGDYAIASPWKFFPVTDGGIVASAHKDLDGLRVVSPGTHVHAKALLNALEHAFRCDRLGGLKILLSLPLTLQSRAWRLLKRASSDAGSPRADSEHYDFSQFHPDALHRGMSIPSRMAIRFASLGWIAEQRRNNYKVLEEAVRGLPGCRPLFPSLPYEVVPQVFPLVVDDAGRVFSRLKHEGVPIIRFGELLWPGVDETVCATSVDLSRRVFQFPCHQELHAEELRWMADRIAAALKNED